MDLSIIKAFQAIRNPILDWFFYISTNLGDQYAFIVIAVILYWTYNKKYAHKFALTFMISAMVNSGLKEIFKRPRPYTQSNIDSPFGYETTGYSFPSGHAQASGVLGYTAYDLYKKHHLNWIKWLGLFIIIVVPISRVYLVQHYLSDVLVGVVLSVGVSILMFKWIDKMNDKEEIYTLYLLPFLVIAMIFVKNHDLYIAAGGFMGFAVGYFIEKRYVKYEVKNTTINQILKVVIGVIIALVIKEGLKLVFPEVLIFDAIRYLMIGGWAALGAPYMFKYVFKKNI
ncbi:MAG: phosphatase PAP2 family protein [Acholeplasmataceae bacterium]|nr:phosphatase PAP2 family protein [Acholeplasmataceae bacterium]